MQANASVKEPQATKTRATCFAPLPAVMTYPDNVLFKTATPTFRNKNINTTGSLSNCATDKFNKNNYVDASDDQTDREKYAIIASNFDHLDVRRIEHAQRDQNA